MKTSFLYTKIIEAKDGNLLPICENFSTKSEISLHSKYNPIREAESFAENTDSSNLFFVVFGIAGAYHIKKLLEKNSNCKILAVEYSEEALSFLKQLPLVKELSTDKRVYFSSVEEIAENILSIYKPAIHGNLTILALRQWEITFNDVLIFGKNEINKSIKLLAADYSVQSHFGKIWQKNILDNLSIAEKTKKFINVKKSLSDQIEKTAAIIAAGPSLDKKIKELMADRDRLFIIATDTAYSALEKQGIHSDAVISIDGQNVSLEHFIEKVSPKTLYVFDLCSSSSAVRKVLSHSENILLSESGHPLSQYASLFSGKRSFVHLNAGSGTVTIAAASLAKELGFKKIKFYGADFSYIKGRPYARGTYLESRFNSESNRFTTSEMKYAALMYRTELIKSDNGEATTEILNAYKLSMNDFMKNYIEKKDNQIEYGNFSLMDFKTHYSSELKSTFKNENEFDESSFAFTTLLPLCAKLGKNSAFIAYLKTLRYTERV